MVFRVPVVLRGLPGEQVGTVGKGEPLLIVWEGSHGEGEGKKEKLPFWGGRCCADERFSRNR